MSLLEVALSHPELADLDPAARRLALRELARDQRVGDGIGAAIAAVCDEIDGFGPLTDVMGDERVTDVLVNGPEDVWIERTGVLERSGARFESSEHLYRFAERLVGDAGGRVDLSHPLAEVTLANGARVHVAVPPVAATGVLISIRKFPRERWTLEGLTAAGMLSTRQAADLAERVDARHTLLLAGATGTGKTTLLGALLGEVSAGERVVTIEETRELRSPDGAHVVGLVAREANADGVGSVDLDALVRAALRMRPDRIVVGEVRGAEAAPALGALATGHSGSLLTIHARSCSGALQRLVSLALHAGAGASEASVQAGARSAIDAVVHLARVAGKRRVVAIEDVT